MKRAHLIAVVVGLVIVGGGSFWAWSRAQANVYIIGDSKILPPPTPILETAQDDRRMRGLEVRDDGARLLWAPEEDMTILRAGFVDNSTIVLTATTTDAAGDGYRLFTYDLISQEVADEWIGLDERISSAHRPAHKNANAFCFSEKNDNRVFEVWCSDYDWESPKQLTTHDGREDLIESSVSPDGSWVAFEVNRDRVRYASKGESATGTSSVWKIRLDGTGLQELTRGADDRFPAWSADSRDVYFQRRSSGGDWDVYVINADGSNPRPVMRTVSTDERWPTPVSDTGKLAVVIGPKGEAGHIKLLDAYSNAAESVTNGSYGPETVISVSPDGKIISFLSPVDNNYPSRMGLWLKDIDLP